MTSPASIAKLVKRRVGDHTLTRHALARMEEFGLSRVDVSELLTDFECRYEQPNYGNGGVVHQRGQWAAVVDPDERVVITILRREIKAWKHETPA